LYSSIFFLYISSKVLFLFLLRISFKKFFETSLENSLYQLDLELEQSLRKARKRLEFECSTEKTRSTSKATTLDFAFANSGVRGKIVCPCQN